MEIRVYDKELNFLGVIENQKSLIWTRRYFEPGEFELHTPYTDRNEKMLRPGNIITKRGSVEAGVIEDVMNEDGGMEGSELTRKGRFLSSYMSRRLIKQTINYKGTIEGAMKELLSRVQQDNPLPGVEIGEMIETKETIEFQATMKELLEYETKLAKAGAVGYRFRPDFKRKKIIFEIYKGKDRTTKQKENKRVVFSEGYENLNQATYTYNDQTHKTKAIVGGKGEGTERIYVEIGEGEGLDLKELFVDAKDISDEGMTQEEYLAALRQRGEEKLRENEINETMECTADPNINFRYKEDYNLGDIVTMKKKAWGITMHERITEIREIYENGGMSVEITTGNQLPEKMNWEE